MKISLNVPRGTLKRKGEKHGEAVVESRVKVDTGDVSDARETGRKRGYNGLYITYPYFGTFPIFLHDTLPIPVFWRYTMVIFDMFHVERFEKNA